MERADDTSVTTQSLINRPLWVCVANQAWALSVDGSRAIAATINEVSR